MKKLILLIFFLTTLYINAGTTAVTVTLTDADGQTWNNCTVVAQFVPLSNFAGPYLVNGIVFTQSVSASCNGSGVFTMTLTDNATVTPIGTHWQFSICPNTTTQCAQPSTIFVTGATQNLSSVLSATLGSPRINASVLPKAYTDTEVNNPTVGVIYWNVVSNAIRNWNGSSWSALGSGMIFPGVGVANSTGVAWGTSYTVGTGNNNLVQLDSSSKLPAVDGSLLTNLPGGSGTVSAGTINQIGYYAGNGTTISGNSKATVDVNGAAYFGSLQAGFDANITPYFAVDTILQSWHLNSTSPFSLLGVSQDDGTIGAYGAYGVSLVVNTVDSVKDSVGIEGDAYGKPSLGKTLNSVIGNDTSANNIGLGVVTYLVGQYIIPNNNTGGGVVGNNDGILIAHQNGVGYALNVGLDIANQGTGVNNYAIHTAGGQNVLPTIATGNAANFDLAGQLTLSSGTKTQASVYKYISPRICVANSTAATPLAAQVTNTVASSGGIPHDTTTLNAAGTGYVVGDTGTINGGTGATYYITTIGGGGAVATYVLTAPGTSGYTVTNAVATTATSGIGTGFKINVIVIAGIDTLTITVPGGINGDTYNYICIGRD